MKGNIEAKAMKKLNSNSSEFEILLDRMDKLGNSLNTKIDEGFKQVNNRLDKVEKDISLIKSCPTIQKEIKQLKKNKKQ